jgi:hypothetical protein
MMTSRKRVVSTSLAATATAVLLGLGLSQPAEAATFPITHSVGVSLVSPQYPFYEGAQVTISQNGNLAVEQHLIDNSWFNGFNGGADVVLRDGAGNQLWSTQQTHGVDGNHVPFGTSDRVFRWSDQVPQNVLNTPGLQVEIDLYNNPQHTFWVTAADIIRQVAGAVKG